MWALVGPDVEGIPTRVRPYGEGAFLVFPKYRSNMYSLARQRGDEVVPYPNRHVHEKGVITNAVDIHLDSRGTLWVLDSGVVRTLGKPLRKSGPRVLALDADTGEVCWPYQYYLYFWLFFFRAGAFTALVIGVIIMSGFHLGILESWELHTP